MVYFLGGGIFGVFWRYHGVFAVGVERNTDVGHCRGYEPEAAAELSGVFSWSFGVMVFYCKLGSGFN